MAIPGFSHWEGESVKNEKKERGRRIVKTKPTVAEPSAFTCPTVTLEFVTTSAPEKDELSPASVAVPAQPSMSSVPPPEIGAESVYADVMPLNCSVSPAGMEIEDAPV